MAKIERMRILIAEDEGQMTRRVADYLNERGFEARVVHNGKDARDAILDFRPRFVLADLMLPDQNALELIRFVQDEKELRHNFIKFIVMSGHNSEFNVRQAFKAGAADYLVKPFNLETLFHRLMFHCRRTRFVKEIHQREYAKIDESSLMLHLTDLVLRQALAGKELEETLFNLTRMVSMKMDGVRCSIVQYLDATRGVVVTSNDNRGVSGFEVDLNKYPEITQVVNTGRLLAIENIENSKMLSMVKKEVKEISFNSLVVCPIERNRQIFGVLSLRLPSEKESVSDNEIRFIEIVAHVASLLLNNQDFSKITEFWRRSAA